ncbi:hypothetical protein COT12_00855 [Candidatus Berkelbacteria bacterium CG08_land_8_20_14_0_20_39_8]|uniref:Uncharacterized protein n=1 Tax=Candidatus Berkelbacteria bacterium CG08_land_8_20_14_0_20_39_8 TaxID=1974511 RepID=A0A2M6YCP8_9BACT|nr:MAG: hypothetical protein COT12_00855 [Candidatus Berkelbacteria bacterium CG08_land_8_20_14_0_20_39_8]
MSTIGDEDVFVPDPNNECKNHLSKKKIPTAKMIANISHNPANSTIVFKKIVPIFIASLS